MPEPGRFPLVPVFFAEISAEIRHLFILDGLVFDENGSLNILIMSGIFNGLERID